MLYTAVIGINADKAGIRLERCYACVITGIKTGSIHKCLGGAGWSFCPLCQRVFGMEHILIHPRCGDSVPSASVRHAPIIVIGIVIELPIELKLIFGVVKFIVHHKGGFVPLVKLRQNRYLLSGLGILAHHRPAIFPRNRL